MADRLMFSMFLQILKKNISEINWRVATHQHRLSTVDLPLQTYDINTPKSKFSPMKGCEIPIFSRLFINNSWSFRHFPLFPPFPLYTCLSTNFPPRSEITRPCEQCGKSGKLWKMMNGLYRIFRIKICSQGGAINNYCEPLASNNKCLRDLASQRETKGMRMHH